MKYNTRDILQFLNIFVIWFLFYSSVCLSPFVTPPMPLRWWVAEKIEVR